MCSSPHFCFVFVLLLHCLLDHSTSGERTPLTSNSHGNPSYIEERAKFSSGVERAAALSHHHNHHNNGNGEQMMYVLANKKKPCKDRTNCTLAFLASVTALLLCVFALTLDIWGGSLHHLSQSGDQVLFDELGRYIFEDYDAHTPFSDFLPGLAGIYGKPIYAFFVNRGQGIASFGFESKNYPIMEFNPANIAYQNTPTLGFRTFLQGQRGRKSFLIEPFSPLNTNHLKLEDRNSNSLPKRIMYSGENEMQIREIDYQHYLETNVSYFILPEEDFGAFVRRTSITNTHAKESVSFSMLDGLARMQPAGGKLEELLKSMGRTLEGWMGVHFLYPDSISMPFYRLTAEPKDTASVKFQKRGHYCLAMMEGRGQETTRLLPIVYDTSKVFGEDTTLLQPIELYSTSIQNIVRGPQYGMAKTSSCFAAGKKNETLECELS